MGAVVGIEREEMRALFPKMCDGLLYGVQVLKPVKKQSWGFTFRQASDVFMKAPRYMEILSQPEHSVILACRENLEDTEKQFFEQFCYSVKHSKAHYTPVLGLHNCPAELLFESEGEALPQPIGTFDTYGFVSEIKPDLKNSTATRFGFEKIPTYQTDDFWNLPERYKTVVYPSPTDPSSGQMLRATGEFFAYRSAESTTFWHLI